MRSYPAYQKLIQYFLQGLLILAPVTITLYAIYVVFDKIDNILRPILNVPGIGFVMIICSIVCIGYLSSFFLMSRLLSLIDKLLERTPGIKLFYSFIKDFFEAFAGNKKKFTKGVLANVENNDVWRVGFITQEDMGKFAMPEYVAVYLPMAYSVAGNVYIIPKERIRPIKNITSAQAMKFAVSGGVTDFAEDILITKADDIFITKEEDILVTKADDILITKADDILVTKADDILVTKIE